VTTKPQIAPPGNGQESARIIGDVYQRCVHLARAQNDAALVAEADTLALFTTRGNVASTRLFSIRLWRIDALTRLGRGREALDALAWLEGFNGRSYATRHRAAQLHSFVGEHQAAADAAAEALIALPLEKLVSPAYRQICQLRAEALCALGRHSEARAFLISALRTTIPSYDDCGALRRTVQSPEDLDEFFNYLAPFLLYPGHRSRFAMFHYSVCCRDNGQMQRAIHVARQRFLSGLEIVAYGSRKPPEKENWTRDAAHALLDLRSDLDGIGVNAFLISGTLLGCVRDRDIIGHDKDIDTGAFTEIPPEELRRSLANSGRFKVKALQTDKLVQVQHANGVMIDVFLHWREDGKVWHEGQKAKWWNSDFDLEETEFLGQKFMIPTNADLYLTENYGPGWRTPEPDFETFVDTPNMVIEDADHMAWYYYTKLHDYYYTGKPLQFGKVWKALEAIVGDDPPVRAAVQHLLVRTRMESAA
jgi:tetratricopeptide (TPR) repeat protein